MAEHSSSRRTDAIEAKKTLIRVKRKRNDPSLDVLVVHEQHHPAKKSSVSGLAGVVQNLGISEQPRYSTNAVQSSTLAVSKPSTSHAVARIPDPISPLPRRSAPPANSGRKQRNSAPTRAVYRLVDTISVSKANESSVALQLKERVDDVRWRRMDLLSNPLMKGDNETRVAARARVLQQTQSKVARYRGIRKKRKIESTDTTTAEGGANSEQTEDPLQQFFHLVDVIREEDEEEDSSIEPRPQTNSVQQQQSTNDRGNEKNNDDDQSILCNYLPMVREYLNSERQSTSSATPMTISTEPQQGKEKEKEDEEDDEYVYDVYCIDTTPTASWEQIPLDDPNQHRGFVRIEAFDEHVDADGEYDSANEYDSEDSNAAENPQNDYPDEPSDLEDDNSVQLSSDEGEWEYDPGLRPEKYSMYSYESDDD